uniref:Myosin IXB n=1 Tax=Callorhinchus milii TaxID=7868 RepID=A0A4W3H8E9_CALMI
MSIKDAGDAGNQKDKVYKLQVCPSLWSENSVCCQIPATIEVTAGDVIHQVAGRLNLDLSKRYVLAEVKEPGGEEWILDPNDSPVQRIKLWPRKAQEDHDQSEGYYFLLQERNTDGSIRYINLQLVAKEREQRRLVERGFLPPQQQLYDDLCNLPLLAEKTILENLKNRFLKQKIYTYAGSILIAINPFKFLPIYNPKYVKMYENHQLGKLEPHIFAIADVAYHTMLRKQINQCIVISGESGSGKTQSTNFLIHCLTALSQKGYASGVERTILGAGPVLEAFGNAKTAHNNNSSRFGKFIQVNYLESGIVRGAVVEKYLLEKSRLVSQENDERNYHVFYYLLMGATKEERREFHLQQPENYYYLNQVHPLLILNFCIDDGEDLKHDFERLKQAMEMVGFLHATKKQIFLVLSAILYLGNVTYKKKATGRDEGLEIGPPEVLETLSQLLKVKQEMLVEALTKRKTVTVGEKLILSYSLNEAITARDSMAKSLYSALFDWIVLRINHALLNKKDLEESVTCLSIGVLDIFGFEDFENNSFEQFCINYANEQLQYYFNQHIFKLEQEEYQSEGITWHNIDYTDNVGCIHLISRKPTGLFHLLDEESNFPHATNQTLLAKFKQQHEDNRYFVGTPVMEPAFVIQHFAGKVKYQIKDFREKNTDYMRPDIVALLRSSDSAFIRELIGMDPVSVFRWAILRATIRATAAFWDAGRREAQNHESKLGRRVFFTQTSRDFVPKSLSLSLSLPAGVMRRKPRVPLGELQRANTPAEKRNLCWVSIALNLMDSSSLKHIVRMTLYDRTTKSLLHLHKKKKPPSISAQFQASLNKLMETLGKAEPFFIRCIRSNAKKLCLDDELVLQQLKYTGMLETVRIRRSGYSAKYTFQEFVNQFQVLLPKNPKPAQEAISTLFHKMGLNRENCQIGKTKVFMKETERQKLQDTLHKEVMRKIILLQGWFRAVLEKRRFVKMRQAAITIQVCVGWGFFPLPSSACVRRFLQRNTAAAVIQVSWRRCCRRQKHRQQKRSIQLFQSASRGYLVRRRFVPPRRQILFIILWTVGWEFWKGQIKWGKGVSSIQTCFLSGRFLNRVSFCALIDSLRLKSEEEQRAREKARQEDEEREAQTRKTAAASHKPERSTVEGESEAVFRSLAAESSEPEPPWLGSELTPGLMENGESQEQLSKSQENTSGAQGTERTSASREKRENRRLYSGFERGEGGIEGESSRVTGCESLTWFILLSGGEWGACSTLPRHTPPDHGGKEQSTKVKRSRSIKISNATTVSEQWDASVHQEITNSNELKHLDEFLMNKVRFGPFQEQTKMGFCWEMISGDTVHSLGHDPCEEYYGHRFRSYQVNILQSCELCSSYIWTMERALLCCGKHRTRENHSPTCLLSTIQVSPSQNNPNATSQHFGVSVCDLTNEQQLVPLLMEILLEYVEMHGLYTEGIYRKSGAANKMKELRQKLEADPTSVILENYHIHAITGLLKQWLRELPEPLMTYALYSDFLRAIEHPERQEQLVATYNMLEQLPPANHSTLERLIFHLVKVAVVEDTNRMSTNALAIVFAPCILLSPDTSDPLMSMRDVSKTTMCVELLISEQLRKYRMKMDEIAHLETAEHIAVRRLSLLRVSQTPYLTRHNRERFLSETPATLRKGMCSLFGFVLPELSRS